MIWRAPGGSDMQLHTRAGWPCARHSTFPGAAAGRSAFSKCERAETKTPGSAGLHLRCRLASAHSSSTLRPASGSRAVQAKPHTRISREVEFSLKKNYSKRIETAFSRKVPFQQIPSQQSTKGRRCGESCSPFCNKRDQTRVTCEGIQFYSYK